MSSALYAYLYERNCFWKLNRNSVRLLVKQLQFLLETFGALTTVTVVTDGYCLSGCEGGYLTDGRVLSEEYTATIFMTEHLQGRIKLIIDWAKLVVQTAEFLREHNETKHVQIYFLCSHWSCSPTIYFFLWVPCFMCLNGHSVGPIYRRLPVLGIKRTAAYPWPQCALTSTGIKAQGNFIFQVNRKGYSKMCHIPFGCHVVAFHCGDWRRVGAKQDGKVIVLWEKRTDN
jgi:hypothetical protein